MAFLSEITLSVAVWMLLSAGAALLVVGLLVYALRGKRAVRLKVRGLGVEIDLHSTQPESARSAPGKD